jgi:hypothetical protein
MTDANATVQLEYRSMFHQPEIAERILYVLSHRTGFDCIRAARRLPEDRSGSPHQNLIHIALHATNEWQLGRHIQEYGMTASRNNPGRRTRSVPCAAPSQVAPRPRDGRSAQHAADSRATCCHARRQWSCSSGKSLRLRREAGRDTLSRATGPSRDRAVSFPCVSNLAPLVSGACSAPFGGSRILLAADLQRGVTWDGIHWAFWLSV